LLWRQWDLRKRCFFEKNGLTFFDNAVIIVTIFDNNLRTLCIKGGKHRAVFKRKEHDATVKNEFIAGVTTVFAIEI